MTCASFSWCFSCCMTLLIWICASSCCVTFLIWISVYDPSSCPSFCSCFLLLILLILLLALPFLNPPLSWPQSPPWPQSSLQPGLHVLLVLDRHLVALVALVALARQVAHKDPSDTALRTHLPSHCLALQSLDWPPPATHWHGHLVPGIKFTECWSKLLNTF